MCVWGGTEKDESKSCVGVPHNYSNSSKHNQDKKKRIIIYKMYKYRPV